MQFEHVTSLYLSKPYEENNLQEQLYNTKNFNLGVHAHEWLRVKRKLDYDNLASMRVIVTRKISKHHAVTMTGWG